MKIAHTIIPVAIAILGCLPCAVLAAPEAPYVEAATQNRGTNTIKRTDSEGWQQKQDVHQLAVDVQLRSSHAPKLPYEVQCFFVAREDVSNSEYIYDIQSKLSSAANDSIQFQAPPLVGSGKRWLFTSVTGYTSDGQSVTGSSYTSQKIQGSRFYGWIIRVVSEGQVVRIVSNQSSLEDLAKKSAASLDAAAKSAKP